jgi:cytidylate kinase
VVCISHTTGAGGDEVGRLVAERLGFHYVDEEIVARAAAEGRLDPSEVAGAERRRSLVTRVLESMADSGEAWALAHGSAPAAGAAPTPEEIRALIREAITATAARGEVVIVAHAASFALAGSPDVLRVLVTASAAERATRVATRKSLDPARATREVKAADAARRDYLKSFYAVADELPTHYDLVVNTDSLAVEHAASVIAGAASA